jgi:sugar/nucleoside kinase (ribokinase family)
MCTFLGLSRELSRDDVNVEDLHNSKYLYVTGYLWDTDNQKEAVLFAMQEANKAGVKVALSLSDPFCVHRHKDDFLRLLKEHVDIIFANAQEAQALTDTDSPYEAVKVLTQYADIVAVTMNEKGSLLRQGDNEYEIPVYPVQAVDTTGAGDMYAAGLLYGLSQGLPLDVSGRIASYAAAQVVAKLGPRLETIDQNKIEQLRNGGML